jgi:hypothetical protein
VLSGREVSATGWLLVQRSPTERGVSKFCDRENLEKMTRPRPPRGCRAIGNKDDKTRSGLIFMHCHLNPSRNNKAQNLK